MMTHIVVHVYCGNGSAFQFIHACKHCNGNVSTGTTIMWHVLFLCLTVKAGNGNFKLQLAHVLLDFVTKGTLLECISVLKGVTNVSTCVPHHFTTPKKCAIFATTLYALVLCDLYNAF